MNRRKEQAVSDCWVSRFVLVLNSLRLFARKAQNNDFALQFVSQNVHFASL